MRYVTARPASAGNPGGAKKRFSRFLNKPLQGVAGLLLLTAVSAASAQVVDSADTSGFHPPPPVTYTEKFEVYGGLSFMNGQAGQNLGSRYNMGGGEGMLTYFVTPKWGVAGDFRWEGGTTPMLPQGQTLGIQTRPFVSQTIGMGGVQYRGPHNQLAALQFHTLVGVSSGDFTHSTGTDARAQYAGLYPNSSTPIGAIGGSLDINRSARWAVRLSPDMIFEHFGTETREFISISGGLVYRFGKR